MTQECTLVYQLEPMVQFTCADGVGIEKGAILKLTDPMTASLADGDDDFIAGIAGEEKIANDGKTKIGVYMRGIFSGTANGAINVGTAIGSYNGTGADNDIHQAPAGHDKQMGYALETAADNDTFLFMLLPMARDEA
jgi:hypothetical protein